MRTAHETRVDVLGVGISDTTPSKALRQIGSWIENGGREYVCVTPVSGVMTAQRDPAVLRALNGAGLTVPDGMPMVWSGRYAGASGIERVYGPDLMAAVCAEAPHSWLEGVLLRRRRWGRAGAADEPRVAVSRARDRRHPLAAVSPADLGREGRGGRGDHGERRAAGLGRTLDAQAGSVDGRDDRANRGDRR